VYGLVKLKHVTWIFTIHNMFDWIYTKGRTKIHKFDKHEHRVLSSWKSPCDDFKPQIYRI
jgi:hypothetical protein